MTKEIKNSQSTKKPFASAPAPEPEGRFKITARNKTFSGVRAGVRFANGVGYTDDGKAAAFLVALRFRVGGEEVNGYTVDDRLETDRMENEGGRRAGS